ncbi:hypothetical protein BDZ90DRAFT_225203 [Jaminaea rosea]|uniref:GPI8-GPI-anchor transamidase n=1 Tax=Jaminaea rosea TaxID=1569628 RepID=A0A316UYP7_9BASI|nr:hypothetical protein BDZ90DRAFT_225203 [Jaminaea rosea]PWN30342.1 hypothetical protein BDZ90DRAFT_225203 [Jaminaea rosea]
MRLGFVSLILAPLLLALTALALPLLVPSLFISQAQADQIERFFAATSADSAANTTSHHAQTHGHTNNWAVLVSASRFWFNYRHMSNTLGLYRVVKRLGIPDSQIILMLADDAACDPRNRFPGNVWADSNRALDLYGGEIQVDYKGSEVTVEALIRLLTGRHPPSLPASKRLLSDSSSNVLLYLTGHGGEDFLKFQDAEELGAWDLADALGQMDAKRRYHELLFIIDTCQANSMYSKIYSPNVIAVGSSQVGQNSYSHHTDADLGIALIDRFTRFVLGYLDGIDKTSGLRLVDLFGAWDSEELHSDPGVRSDLLRTRKLEDVKLTDFFGGRRRGVTIDAPAPGKGRRRRAVHGVGKDATAG